MTSTAGLTKFVVIAGMALMAGCCPPCNENAPLPYVCPWSEQDLWTYEEEPDAAGNPVMDGYSTLESELFNLINQERTDRGICPLAADPCVFHAARLHTQDMADNNYFNHVNGAGENIPERLNNEGIPWTGCAENIGIASASGNVTARILQAWMESDEHRKNILNCHFTHTGIGVAYNYGEYYFTQNFTAY